MLEFASNWPWAAKAFLAVVLMAPIPVLLVFFEKRFNLPAEAFFFAWIAGAMLAFVCFAAISPSTSVTALVLPLMPFLLVVALGALLGGISNVMVAQSISAAPNPGIPWAIIAVNTPIAYVLSILAARSMPQQFPAISFSWINLLGILLLVVGIGMAMHKSS